MSLRQEGAECDGNCRGEKLDEPGPQAAFAAQDAGQLVAPAFRAGNGRHLPPIRVRSAHYPHVASRRCPDGRRAWLVSYASGRPIRSITRKG